MKTCLAKNPDDRWQTARDLLAELRWIAEGGGTVDTAVLAAVGRPPAPRAMLAMLGVRALLIAALAVPAALFVRGGPDPGKMELRVSTLPMIYSVNPA